MTEEITSQCFQSLSECASGLCGADVKSGVVPDWRADEGEEPNLSESLSVCRQHAESEPIRTRAKLTSGFDDGSDDNDDDILAGRMYTRRTWRADDVTMPF